MSDEDTIHFSFTNLEYLNLIELIDNSLPKGNNGALVFWEIMSALENNKSIKTSHELVGIKLKMV